jgi:hypothetical protein
MCIGYANYSHSTNITKIILKTKKKSEFLLTIGLVGFSIKFFRDSTTMVFQNQETMFLKRAEITPFSD